MRYGFVKRSILFFSFSILSLMAIAQRRLTLKEAIDLSLKNSKQLKVSQARIDEAIATTRQAYEAQLPQATASGSYLRLNSPAVDFKLKTSGSGSSSGSSGSGATPTISQVLYATISASLPIYAGGRIRYGIESSKYLEQAAHLDAVHDRKRLYRILLKPTITPAILFLSNCGQA
jgi:outer membrane protein